MQEIKSEKSNISNKLNFYLFNTKFIKIFLQREVAAVNGMKGTYLFI